MLFSTYYSSFGFVVIFKNTRYPKNFYFSEKIDKSLNMAQLGLDSLMTAEVKQNLYRNFKVELDVLQIRTMTFEDFSKISSH